MVSKLKLALAALLVGIVIVFTLQNTAVIEVRFLFWTLALSQVLLIFGLLVIGVLLGWLGSSLSRRQPPPSRRLP